ncbi:MAG: helix-turn-helix transcriptional regulator [Leptospiraceae bacterium]|nr:helix-turn-helix transcriptional regulator [Leptospiraceae bacterium]
MNSPRLWTDTASICAPVHMYPEVNGAYSSAQVLARHARAAILYETFSGNHTNRIFFTRSPLLILIFRGTRRITTLEQNHFTLYENHFALLPPGLYFTSGTVPDADHPLEQFVFSFDDRSLERYLSGHRIGMACKHPADIFLCASGSTLQLLTDSLWQFFRSHPEPASGRLLSSKLLEVLRVIQACDPGKTFSDWLYRTMRFRRRNLEQTILANYRRGLSVSDLALLTGRSESVFRRDFKMRFDTTPGQWIRRCRLEKARFLLDRHSLPLEEVALLTGFQNIGHLKQSFRRYFGRTPDPNRQVDAQP